MEKITFENLKKWAEVQNAMQGVKITNDYLYLVLSLSNKDYVIGKDVVSFCKGERVEKLLIDPCIRAVIMERLNNGDFYLNVAERLKIEWAIDDPFMDLKNDTITTDIAKQKPFILDITDNNEDDYKIVFQAFADLESALKQAKNILTDTRFKGKLMDIDGEPCLALHILNDKWSVIDDTNIVCVWESMQKDLDIALWQIELFEKLPKEKQILEIFELMQKETCMTLQEFGQLLIA